MAGDYSSLVAGIMSMANANAERGGGSGVGPQFKSTNTKKQNKTAGLMNLVDPGNTFMGLWNREDDEESKGYEGIRPYESITEFPLGKQLTDLLSERMAGQSVGFGDDFVSRTTDPAIATRDARYNEFEKPQISAELSARGMGRSTLAGDLIRRSFQDKERDISNILSERYLQNEMQKREEINAAIPQSEGVTMDEMNTRMNRAKFDYGDYSGALARTDYLKGIENQESQTNQDNMMRAAGTILSSSSDDEGDNSVLTDLLLNKLLNKNSGGGASGGWTPKTTYGYSGGKWV